MSKTYQVETEDEFFERMRSLARKVDRQEFVGAYENASFQSKEEMLQAVSSSDDEAEPAQKTRAGQYVFFRQSWANTLPKAAWVRESGSDNAVLVVMKNDAKVKLEDAGLRVHVIGRPPGRGIIKRDQVVK